MSDYKTANELRRSKEYDKALAIYEQCWADTPDSSVAAAIINCLRGLGKLNEGIAFYENALKVCAATPWLKTEYVWVIYEKYIKPIEIGDKALFMEKANEIMALTTDLLPRKLTAFKVSDVLGREPAPDWTAIRQWLEAIREVENERALVDPGKKLSDKRKWYFKYTKALSKLGENKLSRSYCLKAHNLFKTAYFFRHRAAKCSKALKDYETARREFELLLSQHDEWYVHMDLADLHHELGNYTAAEQHVITAIIKCKNVQLKVRVFYLWAQILQQIDESLVWMPLNFYIKYRESRGWPVSDEIREMAGNYPAPDGGLPELDAFHKKVELLAQKRNGLYQPEKRGAVKNLQEKFGFIAGDDGNDVFFSLGSYKGPRPRLGLRVSYHLKKAYDKRKKRESVEAYDVAAITDTNFNR